MSKIKSSDKGKAAKKKNAEEIKSDIIDGSSITDLVNFSIDRYTSIPNFVRLAEYLRGQQEFGLVIRVCDRAQRRLQNMEKDRVGREIRSIRLAKLEKKLKQKQDESDPKNKKPHEDLGDELTTGETHLFKWVQMEKNINNFLPGDFTLTQRANFDYQLQIARLLINTVLDSNTLREAAAEAANQEVDDVTSDASLDQIIDRCLIFVVNPEHLESIANLLLEKGKFQSALNVCTRAFGRVQEMRGRLEQKIKLQTQKVLLEQEETRLEKIKKELTANQQKLLATHKSIKNLPSVFSFDSESNDAYDTLALNLTKLMLKIAMDFKLALKRKQTLVEKRGKRFTKKEKQALADNTTDKTLRSVLEEGMKTGNVENPNHLYQIAEQLYSGEEWELAYPVISKGRKRILDIQADIKKRKEDRARLETLRTERSEAYTQWKPENMPQTRRAELDKLEFDDHVFRTFESRYKNDSFEQFENLHIKVMKLLVDCMMNQYKTTKKQSKETKKPPVAYEKRAIELLDSIEKPNFIYQLAKHMEHYWKFASDMVIKFGEKCQNITRKIEEDRQRRAPLTTERDRVKSEIEDLTTRNRDVPKEKTDRLEHLNKQIAALPAWVEYANLDNPREYDELNLDVVRVMISAILNNKVLFDAKIAKARKTKDPATIVESEIEAKRQKIQEGIQKMVSTTLERFSNPSDLLKIARDMKNKEEVDIVLQISIKSLQRILDIEVQRNLRLQNLAKLKAAQEAKQPAKVAEIEKKMSDLAVWPHYAELENKNQYAQTKYEIIKVALESVLEHQTKVEANISQQYYLDKKRTDEKKISAQREAMENNIEQVVKLCNANLRNADRLFDICRDLSTRKQASILLRIAPAFFSHIRSLVEKREEKDRRDCYFKVLTQEKNDMARIKKELEAGLAKELADITTERNDEAANKDPFKYPVDLKDQNGLNRYVEDFASLLVKTTFSTNQHIEQSIKTDEEKDVLTSSRRKYLESQIKANNETTLQLIFDHVRNPVFVSGLVRQYNDKQLYDFGIDLGLNALAKRRDVADKQEANQSRLDRIKKLEEERAELDKKRKKLTTEQVDELRRLYLETSVFQTNPSYVTDTRPQQLAMDIAKDLIVTMQKAKTSNQRSAEVVDECLKHITEITTLIQFAKYLTTQTEYKHTIKAGRKCEEYINAIKMDLEKREAMKKRVTDLEESKLKALAALGTSGGESNIDPKIKEDLENTKKELEQLPEIEYDKRQLDSWLLDISAVVIEAAKIEEDDQTLCEQTVMAFKIDTSLERWDQVRNMVGEANWGKIKKDLVDFILKRDDKPEDKIELLLKDGLYEYCLDLFPAPTGQGRELELLLRLWTEVEENDPKLLERFIPLVCRFVKRYYQEHKYKSVDALLDRVAHWFPTMVIEVYRQACDMVLLWILPSQYTRFIDAMKECKKRLTDLNRENDWEELLRDFKRQHYGKRKLMQMLLGVVDDPDWSIEVVNTGKANP
eukprot:TRINITY_DN22490_c0_g1_i2.p1 TRINITY_DN22490_c0_g1~~TRINITY_DN22490_c0_g1_i2.p1  ORF type:complete len:1480 (-),score=462.02 TRINITY_DN22490_c0_g1_i2:54-4493(-)